MVDTGTQKGLETLSGAPMANSIGALEEVSSANN
jgi:hypothetical protein